MKKAILLLFLIFPLFVQAQKAIEVVKLSDGKHITVFDDHTWKYSTQTEISEFQKKASTSTGTALPLKSTTSTSTSKSKTSTQSASSSYSSTCGARTKSGGYCKRVVKGGGRCWQHQ